MADMLNLIQDRCLIECSMRHLFIYLFVYLIFGAIVGCSKEEDASSEANPFNDPSLKPPPDTNTPVVIDSTSFQFLYYNVFGPTCANSGCHDGNFQPDFRTIYSSYNTLVNHDVIQNDDQQSFKYRVEPGNVSKSLLHERLNRFMVNTSGVMPLATEPNSSWLTDSATYKDLIDDWIRRGAPDSYGNLPGPVNIKPQVVGILAFPAGSTSNPYQRKPGGNPPISIPYKASLDIWFAFTDDQTDVADFKLTAMKSSYDLFDFSNAMDYSLSPGTPFTANDFWGNSVSYTHKASLSLPKSDSIGTYLFLRTYLQDDIQDDTTEIPNKGTNDIMRSYFTLKVDSL